VLRESHRYSRRRSKESCNKHFIWLRLYYFRWRIQKFNYFEEIRRGGKYEAETKPWLTPHHQIHQEWSYGKHSWCLFYVKTSVIWSYWFYQEGWLWRTSAWNCKQNVNLIKAHAKYYEYEWWWIFKNVQSKGKQIVWCVRLAKFTR